MFHLNSQRQRERIQPLLFRPMSITTLERAVCFIQASNSKANLLQKHPHGHTRNNIKLDI